MRRIVPTVATAIALIIAVASPAGAVPQTIPNGPWVQERQHVSLERLHNYEEMVAKLQQISQSTQGRVSLEVVGQSNEGRDLYLARVGTGPTKVLYITQQHGNEPLGTEAALQLLQRAGKGGAGWNAILSQITLLVIPKVNPDGAERFQRENHDPDCAGAFCNPGVGFDVNRWHDPAVAPEANPVPEAAAVQRTFARYQPSFVVDYHHQGSYVSDDGDLITGSIFWPNAAGVPASSIALSRQVCVLIYDTMSHYGFAEQGVILSRMQPGLSTFYVLDDGSAHLDAWTEARQRNAAEYTRLIGDAGLADTVVPPAVLAGHRHIFNQYVIRVPRRDELRKHLTDEGIGTEVYYPVPLHLQECFAYLGAKPGDLPNCEKSAGEVLAIPIYPELTPPQQERIADTILPDTGTPGARAAGVGPGLAGPPSPCERHRGRAPAAWPTGPSR